VNAELAFPTGSVIPYAGASAPGATISGVAGWLLSDGSAVSRTTYATLFAVVGTTYGAGDGSTTFNLPDLRGRVLVGKGTHTDVATLGNNDGTALANRRPKHQHTVYDPGHAHLGDYAAASAAGSAELNVRSANTGIAYPVARSSTTGVKVNPEGASTSTSPTDAPAYIVLNYLIKT
jgi:microcystin-dependent protein